MNSVVLVLSFAKQFRYCSAFQFCCVWKSPVVVFAVQAGTPGGWYAQNDTFTWSNC